MKKTSRAPNDTLNTRAKLISQRQPISIGELVSSAKKVGIIHERWQPRNQRSFRHRSHGAVRERPRLANRPVGSQLPCPGKSNRPPSRGGRDRHVDRRPRRPLARPSGRRHQSRAAKNSHFPLPGSQWVHGRVTVVMGFRADQQDPAKASMGPRGSSSWFCEPFQVSWALVGHYVYLYG